MNVSADTVAIPPEQLKKQKFLKIAIPSCLICLVLVIALVSWIIIDSNQGKIYADKNSPDYNAIDVITRKCYFDIEMDGLLKGRVVVGLFGRTVPVTVRNFAELCSGAYSEELMY